MLVFHSYTCFNSRVCFVSVILKKPVELNLPSLLVTFTATVERFTSAEHIKSNKLIANDLRM